MKRFDIDTFNEIADALLRNKKRSLLTGFGIFWGLFMLLFLVGGGKGLKTMITKNFENFATNSIIMVAQETTKPYKGFKEGRTWSLQYQDVDRITQLFPELAIVTPTISQWGISAKKNSFSLSCSMKGVEACYSQIETPELKYGRFLNEVDVQQKRKVCVIGKRVYQSLFPAGGDPCGQTIQVGSSYYQVVGVNVSSSNINIGGGSDGSITVPISVLKDITGAGDNVDMICVVGKDGIQMSSLENRLRQEVSRIHYIDPTDDRGLMMLNMEPMFKIVDTLYRGVNFLIWLVGLGTLLSGVIGVSNIMLVVVRERTTEIGIRRAIGATPGNIMFQIIAESITLTFVAGLLGIVFSVFSLNLLEMLTHQAVFQIGIGTTLLALLLLLTLGTLAGIPPAHRAMHIKPVDAMRDE